MRKRKAAVLALLLCAAVMAGCGKKPVKSIGELVESGAPEKPPEEENAAKEKEEPELPREEEAEPPYVEDVNVYGSSIGNLYNGGMMVEDRENNGFYFYNEYARLLVYTEVETGHTEAVWDQRLISMNLWEGKLYGMEVGENGEAKSLVAFDPKRQERQLLREEGVSCLQLVDGELYFTDNEKSQLRRMSSEGGEEEILTEETIYYPVVYKDMIIFQRSTDGGKLYRMSRDGENMTKLNDLRSYSPLVYRDKIYYTAMEAEERYSLRCMNLDGSGDVVLEENPVWSMQIRENKLYYNTVNEKDRIFCIDLESEEFEPEELELEELIQTGMKEELQVADFEPDSYLMQGFAGDYLLIRTEEAEGGQGYVDQYLYQVETKELRLILTFCVDAEGNRPEIYSSVPSQEDVQKEQTVQGGAENVPEDTETPGNSKEAQARAVAQAIADSIPAGSDLERVRAAAAAVAGYCQNAVYTTEDPDYATAYGLFCKGVYTCAGSTRALGMVLECMGYSWSHANANQWSHQWCELTMDGQPGWADGMGGIADYGVCPFSYGGTYTMPDGSIGYAG